VTDPMFDSHRYYHALKEGGFTERQAETLTAAFGRALSGPVATKADISELKAELKADIGALRLEMQRGDYRMFLRISGVVALLLAIAQYASRHLTF
jgi:hypothetical protein